MENSDTEFISAGSAKGKSRRKSDPLILCLFYYMYIPPVLQQAINFFLSSVCPALRLYRLRQSSYHSHQLKTPAARPSVNSESQ